MSLDGSTGRKDKCSFIVATGSRQQNGEIGSFGHNALTNQTSLIYSTNKIMKPEKTVRLHKL